MVSCSTTCAPPYSFLLLRRTAATPCLLRRRHNLPIFATPNTVLRSNTNPRLPGLPASLSDTHLSLSWFSPPKPTHAPADDDDCNGWAVVEAPPSYHHPKKKGLPPFVIGVIGTLAVPVLAAVAYFSLSKKGFNLQFNTTWRPLSTVEIKADIDETGDWAADQNKVLSQSQASKESMLDNAAIAHEMKLHRVTISAPVDSAQMEALSTLKKLKVVEDCTRSDELCTRREYARWLVRLNSLLERNPKHRIVPSVSLSGSTVAAFDDLSVDNEDFKFIQALAEAGIIPSKLSETVSYLDNSKAERSCRFYPDRLISRQDVISWKAQLEYEILPGITEQMSRTKVDYMDVNKISSDASPELYIDILAGDKSIIRKAFGQTRRLEPNKPVTNAQVAVALTSGRMMAAVCNEILGLEAENFARLVAAKEIRFELLDRGDIKRFWDVKMNEERTRGFQVQELYIATLHDLEQEKMVQVKTSADHAKEKAAMDCQKQLLQSLKKEVYEMSERLAFERTSSVADQFSLRKSLTELQATLEGLHDTKSVLEAEIEALRILRSWVEDDARKSQACSNVLEEVGRRWKWENHA